MCLSKNVSWRKESGSVRSSRGVGLWQKEESNKHVAPSAHCSARPSSSSHFLFFSCLGAGAAPSFREGLAGALRGAGEISRSGKKLCAHPPRLFYCARATQRGGSTSRPAHTRAGGARGPRLVACARGRAPRGSRHQDKCKHVCFYQQEKKGPLAWTKCGQHTAMCQPPAVLTARALRMTETLFSSLLHGFFPPCSSIFSFSSFSRC